MKLTAPFAGTVVAVPDQPGAVLAAGAPVIVLEAMKMEHELVAEADCTVQRLEVQTGDVVVEGQLLAVLADANGAAARAAGRGGPHDARPA